MSCLVTLGIGRRSDMEDGIYTVGCYYCLKTFPREDVTTYVDDGRTPLCPYCGVDSIAPTTQRVVLESLRDVGFGIATHEGDNDG